MNDIHINAGVCMYICTRMYIFIWNGEILKQEIYRNDRQCIADIKF